MSLNFSKVLSGIESTPTLTAAYVTLTVLLSTLTSYVRSSSYEAYKPSNPDLLWEDVVIPALQVVPAQVVFHPWTLWTATFVEITPHQFIVGLLVIWFGVTWLEGHWNPNYSSQNVHSLASDKALFPETFKFLSVVAIFTNLIAVLVIIIVNTLITPTPALLSHPLGYGVYSFILPLAVVAKQLQPETNIKLFTKLKFRFKRLPFILLSSALVLSLLCQSLFPFLPALISFLVSWVYLRYFQTLSDAGILPDARAGVTRGDASDTFEMVEFFPEAVKPVLRPAFNATYEIFVLLGIVRAWNDDDVESGNLRSVQRSLGDQRTSDQKETITTTSANNDNSDERRKQIALKMLENNA